MQPAQADALARATHLQAGIGFWTINADQLGPDLLRVLLLGLNVEESLVVRLKPTSPLATAAADYLARMQAIAEPFNLAKVDDYKQLQRRMATGLYAGDGAGGRRRRLRECLYGAAGPDVRRAVRLPRHHPAFGIAARV